METSVSVFVVLEGTSVLGVATTGDGAEEIADRGSPGRWSEWRDGPNFPDRRRDRDDRLLTQRIVRSPLAGLWPSPARLSLAPMPASPRDVSHASEIESIGRDWGAP